MIKEVIMPKLGETMEEGYLVAWKKEEGDKVEQGDVLFEVMSDKTNFEVEALHEGYLRKKLYEPSDDPIPVITPIAYISDTPDEEIPDKKAEKTEPASLKKSSEPLSSAKTEVPEKENADAPSEKTKEDRIKASPLAKKTAEEKGVDISLITGTGPGGRIEKKDVLAQLQEQGKKGHEGIKEEAAPGGEYTIQKWTPLRKIIAKRLAESKREIPHYYFQGKILADEIVKLKEIKNKQNISLTYTDFLLFITSRVMKEFPLINAGLVNGEIRIYNSVDIGLAVSAEEGLTVPVIRNCAEKDIATISKDRKDIVEKARSNNLSEKDLKNARFVISNLGMYGVENFQPIINPPGVAIMGIGKLGKEMVVIGEKTQIRNVINISISFDHRVIDGSYAGMFYKRLKETFENPALLAI